MTNMDDLLNKKEKDVKTYSLLLIGSPGVGKTAISKRYSENKFDEEYTHNDSLPTWNIINIDYQLIKVQLTDCDDLPDNIMDLSSKKSYLHYDGFILCYSIENKRSFEMIKQFNDKLNEFNSNKAIPKMLIANKCDIINKRAISLTAGNDLAAELQCLYFECSAKSGKNIQEIIVSVVNEIENTTSKAIFSSNSFDKIIYWFEIRKKTVEHIFIISTALHFLSSLAVLGVAIYQGIYTLNASSVVLTFSLLVGLWDLVFSPIGIYSIVKEKKECWSYFLIALIMSCVLFVIVFIWQVKLIDDRDDNTEKTCIYSIYPVTLLFKLFLLTITTIINRFKGIHSNNSAAEQQIDY